MFTGVVKNRITWLVAAVLWVVFTNGQQITNGIDQPNAYLNGLMGRSIGLVCNKTSIRKNGEHLVDYMHRQKFDVRVVFAPEHGFRGLASAGETILDGKDEKTGIPLISLYGSTKKPTPEMLADLDVVVFDIQDVGARFYTYISTMSLVMEACAEADIPFIVLDRPNPNGDYVDGPVLQEGFESFVGMHPVPVVHGMTVSEYALMVNGEGWLPDTLACRLKVVPVKNYTHNSPYELPVAPSPNLPNMQAIRLYPSLCFFEGTSVSVGRGTTKPFQQIGAPWLQGQFPEYTFTPTDLPGAKDPLYENTICYAVDLQPFAKSFLPSYEKIYLFWLIEAYQVAKAGNTVFFNSFFEKLAGNDQLRMQIEAGWSEDEIRASWQNDLNAFKEIRKKYLLYPDFE